MTLPTPVFGLRLLGNFELRDSAGPVELPATAQRLLAVLALHGRPVQRAYVAGTLWPDATDEKAGASLRSALWRVRQSGVDPIEATSSHLSLAPGVDADLPLMLAAAQRLADDAPVPNPSRLAAGFQHDLLPDWYDDWLLSWRERWRQVRLHALESLAAHLVERGDFAQAVDAALAAVRAEPLRESAQRALIQVHRAEGNHFEALRQYDAFARLLSDELGIDPSPALQRLVSNVRRR